MRVWMTGVLVWMAFSGLAHAQSASPESDKGYVEAVAQTAFGTVTSQSYGGELGVTIAPRIKVFVEAGHAHDTSPSTLNASAQLIAGFLARTQSNATFSAKQPVTFGLAGVRYGLPLPIGRLEPYVLGGGGVARVKRDVTFMVSGNDVTNSLAQYGVVLGGDLSGSETKGMLTLGGGVAWPVWHRVVIDFQYRFGRIFLEGQGLNVNRAGIGLGVRF